ncbi:MAG: alpha/beta hydrolase [Deltaproteobacteria bacterium]|nr:MAG: alpha/beta hydrolase [Deltaproteobacteria bacterium]
MNARLLDRARQGFSGQLLERGFRGLSRLARMHPAADPARYGVEVIRDVAWRAPGGRDDLLDVYRPTAPGPHPTVVYVHGGGFRILSKETHWGMALAFAAKGYTVFVPNYRLAPRAPYPAALQDASEALVWIVRHAAEYGGDPERLVLAGESAGANLATGLTLSACYERPEPWARAVFDLAPRIHAVLPACGLLQVSDTDRLGQRGFVNDRLRQVSSDYLAGRDASVSLDLADVVCTLERGEAPARPLPPFFIVAGGKDPVTPDSHRLNAALEALGVDTAVVEYPGGVHAFHAFLWTRQARAAWRDQHAFLDRVLEKV